MAKTTTDTPLMQQHRAIKQKYPDAILLFRVGDFYETFGEDAIKASTVLGITLTKRNNGTAADSELAGFPHHALDTYLHKLVKAGYRVAICDQLEDPKQAKGIVKRGVTELVTPGLATNDKLLEHDRNNFLAAIHFASETQLGCAFIDISTGEFLLAEGNFDYVEKLLQTLQPAEVVFQRQYHRKFKELFGLKFFTYHLEEWIFDEAFARETLVRQFGTQGLKGFGVDNMQAGIIAAGAIFHYLKDTEHPNLQHITTLHRLTPADHLWMDRFTVRNLELLGTPHEDGKGLIQVLDETVSPMGARLLKRWMLMPLCDALKINQRLLAVEALIADPLLRQNLRSHIKQCGDLERLVSKVPLKKINPREVLQIAKALKQITEIRAALSKNSNEYLERLCESLNDCTQLQTHLTNTFIDNPPISAAKGNLIKPLVHAELDDLRLIVTDSKAYLARLQQLESEKTGIHSLKIGYNNVFGYFLEVSNAHKHKAPADWIRKQTLVNAERYITPELKQYEEKISGAEEKINQIELTLFENALADLQDYLLPLQTNGNMLSILDCLANFAHLALQNNYCRPTISTDFKLQLTDARHPVIEKNLGRDDQYVANTITLDPDNQQLIILTGPNMSGKSALLRQTAICTLMAHMGCFVPCSKAIIPVTDKIFTRVGASDNLSAGESTFMVEMQETASIINNLSARSLVLLDEIGRGTSTYDGISIAWSIAEYLHQSPVRPKTLFATHYHELNELEEKLPRVKNFHITHQEHGNKIVFLRKLAPGGSTHSFGIHVAKLAGMPPELISRANEVLQMLETKAEGTQNSEQLKNKLKLVGQPQMQLSIFDIHSDIFNSIRDLLQAIDINRLTPVEALLKLNEIKQMLK